MGNGSGRCWQRRCRDDESVCIEFYAPPTQEIQRNAKRVEKENGQGVRTQSSKAQQPINRTASNAAHGLIPCIIQVTGYPDPTPTPTPVATISRGDTSEAEE